MVRNALFVGIILLFAVQNGSAETNYTVLQNKCQGSTDAGCCISSVRAMRDGKFQHSTDGKCPEGMKANMYRCAGSLSWCEPKDDADIAVNGGGMGNYKKEAKDSKQEKENVPAEEEVKGTDPGMARPVARPRTRR